MKIFNDQLYQLSPHQKKEKQTNNNNQLLQILLRNPQNPTDQPESPSKPTQPTPTQPTTAFGKRKLPDLVEILSNGKVWSLTSFAQLHVAGGLSRKRDETTR